jgi:hypothetical protein
MLTRFSVIWNSRALLTCALEIDFPVAFRAHGFGGVQAVTHVRIPQLIHYRLLHGGFVRTNGSPDLGKRNAHVI